jgi:hypothetical protein
MVSNLVLIIFLQEHQWVGPQMDRPGFGRALHCRGKKRVVGINVSVVIVPFDALKASFTAHSVPNHSIVRVKFVRKEYSRGYAGGNGWG